VSDEVTLRNTSVEVGEVWSLKTSNALKLVDSFVSSFAAETKQEEVVPPVKKAKKSVNFNLEQNQVKEFDKTKKISENVVEEVE
jgi:hypothetical protein